MGNVFELGCTSSWLGASGNYCFAVLAHGSTGCLLRAGTAQ
jgi:hypothetical protein